MDLPTGRVRLPRLVPRDLEHLASWLPVPPPRIVAFLKSSGIKAVRTSVRSTWQNGVAERWVGSARRDCFDHVIALDEAHVRRLAREYVAYYHANRTHDGLCKDTPHGRAVEVKPAGAELVSLPRVGGLHHRYTWQAAA